MLKSHEKFHSANGKRQVLIVDDEFVNQQVLGKMIGDDFDFLYASDGISALKVIDENKHTLSLVLLDLLMPGMHGLEVLRIMKENPETQNIPVVVITSEVGAEIEALEMGAVDFISKPYPKHEVVRVRVVRTIELSEDREIIRTTERDTLTGLYNREYFYSYAEQYDQYHPNQVMDAIVVDVNHFHMINERYGKAYGDDVLRRIGEKVREMVLDNGGIVCRRDADTFLVYCPHGKDYQAILDNASVGLAGDADVSDDRVRLRMGVYANVDKSLDVERRFDRAKMAADTVRNSFTRTIAIYDNALHEAEIYNEQLLEDFQEAIDQKQFCVYYQPKFDVRPTIPVLESAEALVRWVHPKLGMINPGVFIPLFEDNGLIQRLDHFVWGEAAAQVHDWKERFGVSIPVSVNMSRVDMYNPELVELLEGILESNEITPAEFYLEITESAYTQDQKQIVETVNNLRGRGFRVEMDDFGTGYSSLNMISTLPIDTLKLDMSFIRNAFSGKKDTRMIEIIVELADFLGVPVIAEGVETEEQLIALRQIGCDYVQGFYFSRPVPAEEYDRFVEERKRWDEFSEGKDITPSEDFGVVQRGNAFNKIEHALARGFESIFYVNVDTGSYVEFTSHGRFQDLQIERSGDDFFADVQAGIGSALHPDDLARVSASLERETLLAQLVGESSFTMTYRLIIDGEPVYYNIKAARTIERDVHHIVVGVSNVDGLMKQAIVADEINARNMQFLSIVQALSSDFESIYYVDTYTDEYTEFITRGDYETLEIESSGEHFFDEVQKNLYNVVYPKDQVKVSSFMQKETLLHAVETDRVCTLDYRLVIDGSPECYRMKVVTADIEDDRFVVIGVSNVDEQSRREQELEAVRRENATFARISRALAQDYFSIYYVDVDSGEYIEYSSGERYDDLRIEKSGNDFFASVAESVERLVDERDREKALDLWKKENLLAALDGSNSYSTSYRQMMGDESTYIGIKVNRMVEDDDHHIIVGMSNIDAQMRREQEYVQAQELALRDALTGVKNKRAYGIAEEQLDNEIASGEPLSFSIAVCDLNGLKEVNDLQGHEAGDRYLREGCMTICHVFEHSPVFRVGGDEFVAILRGGDFEAREELMATIEAANAQHAESGGAVVAVGIADYIPGTDDSVSSVFVRADATMYENKRVLKGE